MQTEGKGAMLQKVPLVIVCALALTASLLLAQGSYAKEPKHKINIDADTTTFLEFVGLFTGTPLAGCNLQLDQLAKLSAELFLAIEWAAAQSNGRWFNIVCPDGRTFPYGSLHDFIAKTQRGKTMLPTLPDMLADRCGVKI